MIGIVSVWNPKQKRIIGFQNIIGFFFITLWVLLLRRRGRHISFCQRRWRRRRCISLGQRLTGYLVEIQQWDRGRDRKHPWSITQYLEQIRSHTKGNHPLSVLWRRFLWVTSRDVTSGHVTSGSHATFGHEQWYILYYYYSKKKKAGMYFRSCAEHTSGYDVMCLHVTSFPVRAASDDVTSSNACVLARYPLLPQNMPCVVPIYYFDIWIRWHPINN